MRVGNPAVSRPDSDICAPLKVAISGRPAPVQLRQICSRTLSVARFLARCEDVGGDRRGGEAVCVLTNGSCLLGWRRRAPPFGRPTTPVDGPPPRRSGPARPYAAVPRRGAWLNRRPEFLIRAHGAREGERGRRRCWRHLSTRRHRQRGDRIPRWTDHRLQGIRKRNQGTQRRLDS